MLKSKGMCVRKLPVAFMVIVATGVTADAATVKTLHTFEGTEGFFPSASMAFGKDGGLYGTTVNGGEDNKGVVFKLGKDGSYTVLHSFGAGTDGSLPWAGVVFDAKGNLFGTTQTGGSNNAGTVYKIDTSGNESVLYSFAGGTEDGALPAGTPIVDSSGNIYGTTMYGGIVNCVVDNAPIGCGTVFKLSIDGQETVLHEFSGDTNEGGNPYAGLAEDAQDNYYGTTDVGGRDCCGTIFKLSKTGKESELAQVGRVASYLWSGVALDAAGNIYGDSYEGGDYKDCGGYGCGAIYKLPAKGKLTSLYDFKNRPNDGNTELGTIFVDATGNLYGTSWIGGRYGGAVWKLNSNGELQVLSYLGAQYGVNPIGGVIVDLQGHIYGTASEGGDLGCSDGNASGCGTIFEIDQ